MNKSTRYLLIAIATFAMGYIFLRLAYNETADIPFVQEIVLIILGTIVTIAITAALLNKQSEVEIDKEQRVKVFDIKSSVYFDLINFIEGIIRKEKIEQSDIIAMEFLTHKISIIASPDVLKEYAHFIQTFKQTSLDSKINSLESDELSAKLANLCIQIRYDLMSKDPESNIAIEQIITKNIERI